MSGEWFLLCNLVMNAACLLAAGRTCARAIAPLRVLCASALGAALAMVAVLLGGAVAGIPAIALIAAGMAAHAYGLRGALRCLPMLLVCGTAAAGIARVLYRQGVSYYTLAPLCAVAVWLCARSLTRAKATKASRATLRVSWCGKHALVSAIRDSGNLLSDPVSSLPVIVAPFALVKPILPPGFRPEDPETLPRGFRFLSVDTAAGSRLMMCFRPETLFIRSGSVWRAARAIVAVSPETRLQFALIPSAICNDTGGAICLSANGNE